MFGVKKKSQTSDVDAQERVRQEKLAPYEIRVMPAKFIATPGPKTGTRLWMLIIFLILAIGALGAGAYYALVLSRPPEIPLSEFEPATVVSPESSVPVASPTPPIEQEATPPIPPLIPSPTPTPAPSPTQPVGPITYTATTDSDGDGLTDSEEDIYGTNRLMSDTDGDGYPDGAEVRAGYSPLAAHTTLVESGLVNPYTNAVFGYTLEYPSRWLARPTDQSLTTVNFQSATREFISVTARENPTRQSLDAWYSATYPQQNVNALRQSVTRNGLQYVREANNLVWYIMAPNNPARVYEVRYNPGTETQLNFLSTFEMMAESFRVGS